MSEIIYDPTPKQCEFHEMSDDWIILGGNRGGGKSYAILIEALGLAYNAQMTGKWQVLILRRTYKQLTELVTRAKFLYPKIIKGGRFVDYTFKYPNGSFIQFASVERDEEVEKFRGGEFSLIIVDECSHFSSDYVWQFLKGSNRNSAGYPNRMIGTSNPCLWVKKMCEIDDFGNDNTIIKEYEDDEGNKVIKSLRFFKMSMEDNKHLPKDYKQSMMDLPQHLKDEWVSGLWFNPKVPGQILEYELERVEKEGRAQGKINYELGLPVHVFCDLGYSDYTVLLFVQFVGKEIRILDCYHNNRCSVDTYINEIRNKAYPNVIVHLPHDGAKHESSGASVRDYWKERINVSDDSPNGNLPRLSDVESFDRLKNGFCNVWFDSEKCKGLIESLKMYRRKWNENLQTYGDPIHDENSHFYDALKYIFYIDNTPKATLDAKKLKPQMQQLTPW
jgi:hypothetical protein